MGFLSFSSFRNLTGRGSGQDADFFLLFGFLCFSELYKVKLCKDQRTNIFYLLDEGGKKKQNTVPKREMDQEHVLVQYLAVGSIQESLKHLNVQADEA